MPSDTVWRQLLNLWIETRYNTQTLGNAQSSDLQSACAEKMCELAEQFVEQYHPRTGRPTWLNMQLCSCPCCGGMAIYVCKYVNPVTFWVREANTGPSAFYMQDLKSVECIPCGLRWKNFHISLYGEERLNLVDSLVTVNSAQVDWPSIKEYVVKYSSVKEEGR